MILVTGGTGLVGGHLLQALVQQQKPIRAIIRPNAKVPIALIPYAHQIEWFEADLQDYDAIEQAMNGCSHVYHCAAKVSFDPKDKKEIWQTNVQGTAHIVNAALFLGIQKLLYVSSIAAIGEAKPGMLIDETCQWIYDATISDYSISKFEAEREVWRGITEGLNAVIVNPSVILGYDEKQGGSMSLLKLVNAKAYFYPEGSIALVYVVDLCRAMIQLMDSTIVAERFIISAANKSYQDFFALIAQIKNIKPLAIRLSNTWSNTIISVLQLYSFLFKKSPLLSKFTLRASQKKHIFNNQKLVQALSFNYTPIEEVLQIILKSKK
jgi:nucleoside-diphosphate-sugar epimerase